MKHSIKHNLTALLLCATAAFAPTQSPAADIDIFVGGSGGAATYPKILIILDNTSNWSRASQKWPGTSITLPATFSSGSTTVTTSGDFSASGISVGMLVTGTGITNGTAVAAIQSSTSLRLTTPTTASGSAVSLTFSASGVVQGQSEARAINTVIAGVSSNVNLGLMEFVTGGNATDDGGFIRQAIAPMTTANKAAFSTALAAIYNNINSPNEKRSSNTAYGDLMYDAYNYFNGLNCLFPGAVLSSIADANGYTSPYTTFRSPLSDANACGNNYIIFIGNPNASGPAADSAANGAALTALGGSVSPQIQVPAFTSASSSIATNLNYTSQCYASLAACSTTDNTYNATLCASGFYSSCSCSNTLTSTSLDACASGTQRYSVVGNTITGGTPSTVTANVANPTKGISGCHPSSAAAAGDTGGLAAPVNSTTTSGGTTTQISYTNIAYTPGTSASTNTIQDCAAATTTPATYLGNPNPSTAFLSYTSLANSCYKQGTWVSTDIGTLSTSYPNTVSVSGNATTTTVYTVTGTVASYGSSTGCTTGGSGAKQVTVTQSVSAVSTTTTSAPNYKYDVTQTYTQATTTTPGSTSTQTVLGNTSQCYASCSATEFASACSSYNGGCTCSAPTATAGVCASGARYMVTGNNTGTVVKPTGTFITPSIAANADEWARFMHQPKSINPNNLANGTGTDTIKQTITTYTIDVFNAQQNAEETELYMSMARVGGGRYFAATTEAAIVAALQSILAEIQSVNSTFASASLPVNATNRTQNANQVFIGMFRPDPQAYPRWYGNLKQYQIGNVAGSLDLVDVNGNAATNTLTGFIEDCAVSFWTTNSIWPANSSNYWANVVDNPDPASNCIASRLTSMGGAAYSDLPDGPTVEKGAVAEVLRKGNNPGATPTWTTVNRNMLTLSGSALVPFNTTNVTSLGSNVVQFTQGVDVINTNAPPADPGNSTGLYNASTNPYQTRPSIHGDVVHSRPLPVNYGSTGVTVYYGANDGSLRAVDSSNGKERWAYVAPEHFSKLQRLMDNSPLVNYNTPVTSSNPLKDYFFDGSIGVYQAAASGTNPPVWIYPTQRRGGRMVYAFDVSNPAANPILKWRHGCVPSSSGGDVCDSGLSAMGQTWSTPNVAFINGYSTATTKPVVVMGGGYDPCEDAQTSSPSCPSTTPGNVIYFLDADTGNLITSFATLRSVAGDVTLIDLNNDGLIDYAYAADTGGNIYRVDFVSSPTTMTALPCSPTCPANNIATSNWYMHRVAYTNGQGRKFLFGPGLFPTATSAYVAIVSGDREHPLITDYPYTTPVTNRAYVYKDDLTSIPSSALGGGVNLDEDEHMIGASNANTSTCTSSNLLTSTSKKGWFMDLTANGRGEQGVTSAVIVAGMVTFSTNRPLSSAFSCNTVLGEARGYFVNLFDASGTIGTANNASCGGMRSSTFAGGGLPPSPVIGIVPINGVPTAILIGAPSRDGGANSPIKPTKITPPINQTRKRTYKYIKGDS